MALRPLALIRDYAINDRDVHRYAHAINSLKADSQGLNHGRYYNNIQRNAAANRANELLADGYRLFGLNVMEDALNQELQRGGGFFGSLFSSSISPVAAPDPEPSCVDDEDDADWLHDRLVNLAERYGSKDDPWLPGLPSNDGSVHAGFWCRPATGELVIVTFADDGDYPFYVTTGTIRGGELTDIQETDNLPRKYTKAGLTSNGFRRLKNPTIYESWTLLALGEQ